MSFNSFVSAHRPTLYAFNVQNKLISFGLKHGYIHTLHNLYDPGFEEPMVESSTENDENRI